MIPNCGLKEKEKSTKRKKKKEVQRNIPETRNKISFFLGKSKSRFPDLIIDQDHSRDTPLQIQESLHVFDE